MVWAFRRSLWRPETGAFRLIETHFERFVSAGDDAEAFLFADLRLRGADGFGRGLFENAHIGRVGHNRVHVALRGVGEIDLAEHGSLFAGVVALRDCLGAGGGVGQDAAQCIFGGGEVLVHVDMGNVEGFAGFIEMVRLTIFGEQFADLQPGGGEEIAHGALVLVTIHAATRVAQPCVA